MKLAQEPDTISDIADRISAMLPNLLVAAALVVAGIIAARLLQVIAVRLLRVWSTRLAGRIGRVFRSRDVEARVRRTATDKPLGDAVGRFVFWLVFLIFLAAATQALGLPVISAWVGGLAAYLPRVLAAGLVVLLGVLAGGFVRNTVTGAASRARFALADVLGRIAQVTIVLVTFIVAFDQLGLEITFLIVLLAVATASMLGGAALAFGLGARTAVSNIIASHYVLKIYRVGHQVRIGNHEGRILEITPTSVILAVPDGRVVIPCKEFSEQTSVLLTS